jgi:hypothetical protein
MEFDSIISGGAGGNTSEGGDTSSTPTNDIDFKASPWGRLEEVGIKSFKDVFDNVGAPSGGSSEGGGGGASGGFGGSGSGAGGAGGGELAYGGNPFAGDNFWNIFAGGVNPSNIGSGSGGFGGGGGSMP